MGGGVMERLTVSDDGSPVKRALARGRRGVGHQLWRVAEFVRCETVLSIAALLAVASCALVPPDAGYASYIDIETLGKLFSLMLVMAGLQRVGLFRAVAGTLLGRVSSLRGIAFVLVGLCFFSSMLITNDVALVTFVPLALMILGLARADDRACLLIVLMTIAANLGSMALPMGNPQNLYLFGRSGLDFPAFIALMAPYTAASAVLLALAVWRAFPGWSVMGADERGRIGEAPHVDRPRVCALTALFVVCLGCVAGAIPLALCVGVVLAGSLLIDRTLVRAVDYGLLLTFVAFYVFVGNMGRFAPFADALAWLVTGRELAVSVAASQVISNVPAALLLSGFTREWPALIIGTNLGGLGTIIASMASLISYKQLALVQPARMGHFMKVFTVLNVAFLAALAVLAVVLFAVLP